MQHACEENSCDAVILVRPGFGLCAVRGQVLNHLFRIHCMGTMMMSLAALLGCICQA